MIRPRLLTLMLLGMAVVSTLVEAKSQRIHVTAEVVQVTFTGDPASPKLGDRRITSVDLFDQNQTNIDSGGGSCTIVSIPPRDTLEECLLTAVFAEGQIIFGGWPRWPRWEPWRGSASWVARTTFGTSAAT